MKYNLLGTTINYFLENSILDIPDYIKIDVDGIEHLILEGMGHILDSAKSVLIELTSTFREQFDRSQTILKSKNFHLDVNTRLTSDTSNQIWVKDK